MIERDGCCYRQIRTVFHLPLIEDGVTDRRRPDVERFQLLHEAVAQRQVVRDDDLSRFEAVRDIAEQDVLRDVVVPGLR
jgi:hypothetical protein